MSRQRATSGCGWSSPWWPVCHSPQPTSLPYICRRGSTLAEARPRVQALVGLRDRALLLVGFGGAFRRSEPVSLDVADVRFAREGPGAHPPSLEDGSGGRRGAEDHSVLG